MTTVSASEMYEWPMNNDEADCEGCGKVMQVPNLDDPNRDMKEPFWIKEKVHTYIGGNWDKFHSYCEECFQDEVFSE